MVRSTATCWDSRSARMKRLERLSGKGRNAVPALPQGGFREDDRPQVRLCRPGERHYEIALCVETMRRSMRAFRRGRRQRRPARHGTHTEPWASAPATWLTLKAT
ncbi:MAG: hypothetical protein ACLRM8_00810 [Alistipes sp.]